MPYFNHRPLLICHSLNDFRCRYSSSLLRRIRERLMHSFPLQMLKHLSYLLFRSVSPTLRNSKTSGVPEGGSICPSTYLVPLRSLNIFYRYFRQ